MKFLELTLVEGKTNEETMTTVIVNPDHFSMVFMCNECNFSHIHFLGAPPATFLETVEDIKKKLAEI